MQDPKKLKVIRFWYWSRNVRQEVRGGENVITNTQRWIGADTLAYRSVYSVNRSSDFLPLFHSETAGGSSFYGIGMFNGRLYYLGRYPGAVYDEHEVGNVHGSVYRIINPDEVFEKLDDYEGIGSKHQQPNEYVRQLVTVEIEKSRVDCWVYIYNLEEKGLERIATGRYLS